LSTVTISAAELEIEHKRIIPVAAKENRWRFIACLLLWLDEAACAAEITPGRKGVFSFLPGQRSA
jgi:hypothetical protein